LTDIAPIKGLIELQDEFTTPLGLAEAALQNFSKTNQESLKAVAGVVGIVTAAITATAVATIELGKRGAEVNDVKATMVQFAGSAKLAADDMDALRKGTKNIVDDFSLAKDAAKLLSAGVHVTADEFNLFGEAAIAMQHRGLGPAKENLEAISEAMLTGRTRALSMKLGVADITDAEEAFAKTLGVSKDDLNEVGKAEANRIAIMKLLKDATKDAKDEQRNFGEEIEFAKTQVTNWLDDLGSAVAKSEVFKVGMQGIEDAVKSAFSGDKAQSIKTIVGFLEEGAITVISFGQVAITMAKGVESAFNLVKTVVLGLEGVIVAIAEETIGYVQTAAEAGKTLHLISADSVASVTSLHEQLKGMRTSFEDQTAEAAKSILGHTALDDTFDKLSDTLGKVKASMLQAKDSTKATTEETDKGTEAVKKAGTAQDDLNNKYLNTEKIQKALQKSTQELATIWADYYALVAKDSKTSAESQQADIEATFQKNVNSLDKLDPLYKQKYAAYRAIADESLKAVGMSWDSVKDQSLEALKEQADNAEKTYNAMLESGLTFSREVLDAQRQKWMDLRDAVRDYGTGAVAALAPVVDEMHALIKASDDAYEAQKKLKVGFSFDVTSQNFQETAQRFGLDNSAYDLAKKGYSFAEIVQITNNFKNGYTGPLPPPQGPRIPGFAEGGVVMVGERGPEAVRLPFGSQVYPSGSSPESGHSITFGPGSVVVQYPIMNSPRAINELGNALGDVLLTRMRAKGYRVG